MPLSDAEIRFVDWVKGKKIDVAAVTDSAERQQKKEAFLTGTLAVNLDKARGEIDAAQGLIIQKTDDPNLLVGAWRKMTKTEDAGRSEMKWRATDDDVNQGIFESNQLRADVEVDTTADIDANTDLIDIGAIQALQQSFERIKEMERAMRSELDKNGEPVFTDADIRRELWTPLVRSGLIPENMVPNEFSEQAIAFKGAKDLYEDKLQEHTASTSAEQENLKIGLRIAKEVVKVAGSIVSNSITIANAPQIASLKSETANLAKVDPQTDAITKQISDLKDNVARLEAMATHAETATTLAAGAISGIEMIADHKAAPKDQPPIDKWLNTISKGVELAQKMSVACVGSAFVSGSDGGRNSTDLAKCVTGAMNAGFTAGRLVPSLALIVREPDETKRAKLIAGAVNDFASAVSSSINAAASQIQPASSSDADKAAAKAQKEAFAVLAGALKGAIMLQASAPAIIRAYETGDRAALGLLLGGAAVQTVLNASADSIYDAMRKDVSSDELAGMSQAQALFHESNTNKVTQATDRATGTAASIDGISTQIQALNSTVMDSLRKGPVPNMSPEQLQATIAATVMKAQEEAAAKDMAKAMSKEAIEAMIKDADAELAAFDELYSKAYPDRGVTQRPPLEIEEAMKSIDRAMAATAALRQRVAIINGVTSSAAGLLAAIVPGTGAVVAAQKLAYDIYLLVKAVDKHNTWVDSMEVSLAGQSGVSAAVENTLKNARIQLSQKSVTVVLDSIKVSAEVARVFDPTGAATGVAAGTSMAQAVVDFGYAMHTEAQIKFGWDAYVEARTNPNNRKAARAALRLNSTLAKCCIAYGASIMGDTSAKQAMRANGLSVAVLQDDKDICLKLVAFLETELSEDPTVLRVDYKKDTKWFPGQPKLDHATWLLFKAAARKSAMPRLAEASLATSGIDRMLIELGTKTLWSNPAAFKAACEGMVKTDKKGVPTGDLDPARRSAVVQELDATMNLLDRLDAAFADYNPTREDIAGRAHESMAEVAGTFATLARGWKASVTKQMGEVPK